MMGLFVRRQRGTIFQNYDNVDGDYGDDGDGVDDDDDDNDDDHDDAHCSWRESDSMVPVA